MNTWPAAGEINLQATVAAASAGCGPAVYPHHPIVCHGELRYKTDGTFACEHAKVGSGDRRTRWCVDHSIAILLMELAVEAY